MCTSKKLLFSTRSYRLRKWIESQYNAVLYKATTTNSYYYIIKTTAGISYKIRISDHLSKDSKNDYSIVIAYNPHDINRNVYLVSQLGFEQNVIAITDFKELKYDINRCIIFSNFYTSYQKTLQSREEIAIQKINENETPVVASPIASEPFKSAQQKIVADIMENHIQFPDKEIMQHMNDKNRTKNNNIWPKLCLQIPNWLKFPKPVRKALRDLFDSQIDFLDGCKFVEDNKNLTTANLMIAIYKKRNEYLLKAK